MLPQNLRDYASQFSEYTELRVQENRNTRIALLNGDITGNTIVCSGGMSARVCRQGLWGFASSPQWDQGSVKRVLASASKNPTGLFA